MLLEHTHAPAQIELKPTNSNIATLDHKAQGASRKAYFIPRGFASPAAVIIVMERTAPASQPQRLSSSVSNALPVVRGKSAEELGSSLMDKNLYRAFRHSLDQVRPLDTLGVDSRKSSLDLPRNNLGKDFEIAELRNQVNSTGDWQDSPRRRIASVKLVERHPEVYEPCDDSFALVDALLADKVNLVERHPSLCLEVGCGSGYVITSLALLMGGGGGTHYMATDINSAAAQVTCNTLASHGVEADVIVTNLVTGLEKRLAGSVDVLVFNPPYVPTPEEEVGAAGITASWAGGDRGRTVIDRMLAIVDTLMSSKGLFYLLTLTANNPGEICKIMKKKGFASRIVIQRSTEEESLHVLKFWREDVRDASENGSPATLSHSLSARISRLAFWR